MKVAGENDENINEVRKGKDEDDIILNLGEVSEDENNEENVVLIQDVLRDGYHFYIVYILLLLEF